MAPFAASDQEVMMAVVHRDGLLLRLAHDALKVQRIIVDFIVDNFGCTPCVFLC